MYFVLKLIAKGYVHSDSVPKYWKDLFPEPGSKTVGFSPEIPQNCAGFRLKNLGKGQLHNVPVKGYHFNDYGVPYTEPCKHDKCKVLDKYIYALIRAFSGEYIPAVMGDGSAIFKMLTTGSWLMAQMDCLHKYGSLQHFYHTESLWPINIHKVNFDVTDVLWIPGSLLLTKSFGSELFDDRLNEIMMGINTNYDNSHNREIFGVHGVVAGELELEQSSPKRVCLSSVRPPNADTVSGHGESQSELTLSGTVSAGSSSKSQVLVGLTSNSAGLTGPAAQNTISLDKYANNFPASLSSPPSPETNYPFAAFGLPLPSFSSQPLDIGIHHPSFVQSVSPAQHPCVNHHFPSSSQKVPSPPASQVNLPSLGQLDNTTKKEKKDRFLVKVKADSRGEKMVYVSRDLASWGDKGKLIKSDCPGCKLALNKMNTVSIRLDKDAVPLIREVITIYKSHKLDMEPIREVFMDKCFKGDE